MIREIAGKIGEYYLNKFQGDRIATINHILDLRIVGIEVELESIVVKIGPTGEVVLGESTTKRVVITTERPELLIGKRGENVDGLGKFLKTAIRVVESRFSYVDAMLAPLETDQEVY